MERGAWQSLWGCKSVEHDLTTKQQTGDDPRDRMALAELCLIECISQNTSLTFSQTPRRGCGENTPAGGC